MEHSRPGSLIAQITALTLATVRKNAAMSDEAIAQEVIKAVVNAGDASEDVKQVDAREDAFTDDESTGDYDDYAGYDDDTHYGDEDDQTSEFESDFSRISEAESNDEAYTESDEEDDCDSEDSEPETLCSDADFADKVAAARNKGQLRYILNIADPVHPADSTTKSADSADPADAANSVDSADPADAVDPADPADPADSTWPANSESVACEEWMMVYVATAVEKLVNAWDEPNPEWETLLKHLVETKFMPTGSTCYVADYEPTAENA